MIHILRHVAALEIRQLFQSRAVVAALVLVFVAGLAGVEYGRIVIERQRQTLAQSDALQWEQHAAILEPLPPDSRAGDQLYYLFFHTAHEPTAWAPFSVGQRDVQAFNLKVRLLALHGQLYNSDLTNPLLAAFGNFDAAFVMVWLVPLLIIALTYNLWSAERELGTWDLIRSQSTSGFRVLALKLGVRAGVILVLVIVLVATAAARLDVTLDTRLWHVLALSLLYVAVWIGAGALVASLGRSSDFNIVALLGVWVVWAVLAPSLLALAGAWRHPLPEALELTVRQRQGYHASWDRPVPETMQRFYQRYPEWRHVTVPQDTYSNAWYYAMQHAGDAEASGAVDDYFATLERRRRWTARAATLFPPAALQLAFNDIARTDLESHVNYLRSVADYHEQLKAYFFPVVFDDTRSIGAVRWKHAPAHRFQDTTSSPGLFGLHGLSLSGAALALLVVGLVRLRAAVSRAR